VISKQTSDNLFALSSLLSSVFIFIYFIFIYFIFIYFIFFFQFLFNSFHFSHNHYHRFSFSSRFRMDDTSSSHPAAVAADTYRPKDSPEVRRLPPISNSSKKTKSQVGPWKLGRTLGRGSSGRVRLAKHVTTGQLAAVKIVPKSACNLASDSVPEKAPYGIEREIIVMKLIQHPNVMALYDVWENKGELYLVLEYIEGGELFTYLLSKGYLSEAEAVNYFSQIVHGLDYCHRFNICHRDLKPENILLDKHKNIKIADFGMAALETSGKMLETSCGSPHYASPEIVAGKNYHGAPYDIWSCGVILFALLTGYLPFDDDNIRRLLLKVQQGRYTIPEEISDNARDLISKMLCVNPDDRITIPEILKHPLLMQYSFKTKAHRQHVPKPIDADLVSRPVNSEDEIDLEILKNLQTLWNGASRESVVRNLLSEEQNYEKTFYCLLMKYRTNHSDKSISKRHSRRSKSSSNKSRSLSRARSRSRSRSRIRCTRTRSQKSLSKFQSPSLNATSRKTSPPPPLPTETESLLQPLMCIKNSRDSQEFASMVEQAFDFRMPTSTQYQSSLIKFENSQSINKDISTEKNLILFDNPIQYQFEDPPSSPELDSLSHAPLPPQTFEEDRFADAVEEEVDLHVKRRLESSDSKHARKLFLETPPRREIKPTFFKRTRNASNIPKPPRIDENHVTPSGNQSSIPSNDSDFAESQLHISELLKTETFQPRFDEAIQYHKSPATFTSKFGPNTKFTITSSMQLTLPKPLETRHFRPNNSPIFDKPRVRMHNRTSEVSLGPSLPEVRVLPKSALSTSRSISPPTPSSSPASSAVSKSKNILRKFTLVSKKASPPPPQQRMASNDTTFTQASSSVNGDTSYLSNITVMHHGLKRQPSTQPKQNWFMKMLSSSSRSETKGFYSPLTPAELRRTIILILSEWQRYGISRISEEESGSGYLIRAKVSSTNVLMVRSARLRIELGSIISGTAATRCSHHRDSSYSVSESTSIIVVRERGSSNSFLRFLGELERELERRELLQPEGKLESVKALGIYV
jgi:serine/threonine protein kinase